MELEQENLQELRTRVRKMSALTKNVPCGLHQCMDDEELTIISMSDSFLEMFGYSREDIDERFQNRFARMIFKEDREAVFSSMKQQLSIKNDMELEFRIPIKDGGLVWILNKGKLAVGEDGQRTFYCVMLDITEQRRHREDLRLSLERHQVIMDQATDIIFEWNIADDTLTFSSNWSKKFGYSAIREGISSRIPLSPNIHPDDMKAFISIMTDTAAGVPYSETEFRIRNEKGKFTWCRIRATTQFDNDRRPLRAVGVIVDIEDEKRKQQELLIRAQNDSLTGLYNKAESQKKIEEYLEWKDCEKGVLFLIDVDDFKFINDQFGHLCGDKSLTGIASMMRNQFRFTDVVGRVGGDEFLAFLPGVSDLLAAELVDKVIKGMDEIRPEDRDIHLSCSIGIAFYPRDGRDFYTLYRHADQALYHVKNTGKGGSAVYNSSMKEYRVSIGEQAAACEAVMSD